ncbi:hypothetical protein CAMGR0001_0017 [Campylobacter gracilis RM3268]|uniref:Uncharacterized protein n=1 Tax=Campylobacter gracilis RM3268 TaxID=553220 RepID=C8PI36_9BACT|nr:hypothetical protein CAMGR0001_0017 [Campylobacter gracilis RM3268]
MASLLWCVDPRGILRTKFSCKARKTRLQFMATLSGASAKTSD